MKNTIKTFSLFIRNDTNSKEIAERIRYLNNCSQTPLIETNNGDLIIAIGGDGTFIDAVTSTNFSKEKIYAGIHTGTLGFLQNLSSNDIFTLIKYLSYEKEIKTRKVFVPLITVNLKDNTKIENYAINEVVICGKNYSKISFSEYVNNELFQKVSANAVCVASYTGDTALSMNLNGSIDFSNHFQLTRTLDAPISNATYERFIKSPIICTKLTVELKSSSNINIIIDGILKDIDSEMIKSVDVSMLDGSYYIHKFESGNFSKTKIIREKILGYK